VAEKHGVHVTWREYLRWGVPSTLIAVAIANVILVLRYG
jgi:Na+/H+ antiporter NhaD/arsenite permease-like protein